MNPLSLFPAMVGQVLAAPEFIYVAVIVNAVIFAWEAIPQLPSRLVPVIAMVASLGMGWKFVSPGTVPPDFASDPRLVIIANSLLSGLISCALHAGMVAALRFQFGWPPPANVPNATQPKSVP